MQTNKLDAMEARFRSLEDQLSDPSVISNQNKWRTLSKEHSDLGEIVTLYRSYKKVDKTCKEAVNILEDKSQSDLHELAKEELKEKCPNLEIVSSWNDNFEIMKKGSSKGEAVQYLAKYLGLDKNEVMCIGDSENDLSMIKFAGIGVAMGNAIDKVKLQNLIQMPV